MGCPLCNQGTTFRFRKQDAEYRRCDSCGFLFARGPSNPNLETPLAGFESAYLHYLRPDPSDLPNLDRCWRWMVGFGVTGSSRLLDVGAGSGKFVRYLRAQALAADGVEPSQALFDAFLEGDMAFRCGDVASLRPEADATYDVVTALDVIEHVQQPDSFLCDVVAVLKPGGLLFVSTPDMASPLARMLRRHWHFYNRYHLSYFSTAVLRSAAARRGLEMVDCSHPGRVRSLGYVVRYFSDFVCGVPAGVAKRCDNWRVHVNLLDTMHVAFRKVTTGRPSSG